MHSSMMRTACLLTVSCSILCISGGSTHQPTPPPLDRPGGLPNPPDVDPLEANYPGCRPPSHPAGTSVISFLKTTISVISVHILALVSMRKYILHHK